jgi:putative protein-disulfide isomerase
VKQLQVKGFPCLLLQVSDSKFYLLAQGYTDYETLKMHKAIAGFIESGNQSVSSG